MTASRVRFDRAVVMLAIALLPWVVLSRVGEWRGAPGGTDRGATDAIDALRTNAVVTSDRVRFSTQGKRADGKRHVSVATPAQVGAVLARTFARAAWPPGSTIPAEPFALCLACRSPPLGSI